MNDLEKLIRLYEGADYFEPLPDPEIRAPGLIILGLSIAAWAVFIGAGYAIYKAAEALAGA